METRKDAPPVAKEKRTRLLRSSGVSPSAWVELDGVAWVRGHRLGRLVLHPFRYDASSGQLDVARRMVVRIEFGPGGSGRSMARPDAPSFEESFRLNVLNADVARAWKRSVPSPRGTGDSFASAPVWVRIPITQDGIYRLDYFTFSNLGIDPAGVDPNTVRVFAGSNLPLRRPYDQTPPTFMTECALLELDDDADSVGYFADAVFDIDDRFLFQALGPHGWGSRYDSTLPRTQWMENPFTDTTYCWVTWGGSFSLPPKRMAERSVLPSGGPYATTTPRRAHFERNNVESFDYAEEDGWHWENLFGRGADRLYLLNLDDVASTGNGAIVSRVLSNGLFTSTSIVRDVELKVQGQIVADSTWSHSSTRSRIDLAGSFDNLLANGQNSIRVNAKTVLPNSLDRVYTAWFEIEYEAALRAASGSHVTFFSTPFPSAEVDPGSGMSAIYGSTEFRISDFRTNRPVRDVYLFDVSDQHEVVRLTGFGGSPNGSISAITFSDQPFSAADSAVGASRWYTAVTMEGVLPLPSGEIVEIRGLRGPNQGEYAVIYEERFEEGAERLAAFRAAVPGRERTTTAINVRDVYNEFSWGMRDPVAIRNFLASTYANWVIPPFFVSLIGDAAYDTKKFLSGSPEDLLGTYIWRYQDFSTVQYSGGENLHFYPTDDFFGYIDTGDYSDPTNVQPALDVAIGRYPVTDPDDLDLLLDKLETYVGYESPGQWQNRIILTADDERTLQAGAREPYHTTQIETLARERVPPAIDKVKVYLTEYQRNDFGKKPDAQAAFIDEFTRGALMVTYTGHGDQNTMAQEEVFVSQKIASLLNEDRYTVFSTFSCTVSRFDLLSGDSMTERILVHDDGGAVTTFASGGLVFPSPSALLNQAWLGAMFGTPYPINTYARTVRPIGEAAIWAKVVNGRSRAELENSEKYVLLGDPALEVRYGRAPIEFEAMTVDSLTVEGLLRVVRGSVLNQQGQVLDGTGPDPPFNGSAFVHVTDQANTDGYDYDAGHIDYVLEGPSAFRGEVPVVNGRFEAKFFLSEAVQTGNQARISVFALEDGPGRDASGAADSLLLAPTITAQQVNDGQGPVVTVRFEGYENFRDGDFLFTDRPVLTVDLQDESGINLGPFPEFALLAAKIDDGDQIDLSSDFSYSKGSFTQGRVRRILPVTGGTHTLEVKAF
ncbi:MAG TPA: C25 family cysteine peptidase, partial [bacterium]|nr:C25 family cysteine peptidase [bacterium]